MTTQGNEWSTYVVEEWTEDETAILNRYFTNLDCPVFCIINLPQVVSGALFARYSRTTKSTRRLFLDEFYEGLSGDKSEASRVSTKRAEQLYHRVFDEFDDESVTQLGGVHLVFEQSSNIVINEIEWGRLAAYLEQSTRYIDYSVPLADGRFRYRRDPEILDGPNADEYVRTMDELFGSYQQMFERAVARFEILNPRENFDGDDRAYRTTIRAKAFDTIRTMLPAGIVSNVGFFGSAQAAANMLRRLLSSELAEARTIGQMALQELRHPDAAPAFFNQIDDPVKGVPWVQYFRDTREQARQLVRQIEEENPLLSGTSITLPAENVVDLAYADPNNEVRVAGAILYEFDTLGRMQIDCDELARAMSPEERAELIHTYCGKRGSLGSSEGNRRWKPGRAFEHARYSFNLLIDFGIMRDWKRHRMLTIDWGKVTPYFGWTVSPFIEDMEQLELYQQAMEKSRSLYELLESDHPEAAQYAVCLAYRMRVSMEINARALMFMLELRTSQQGHPSYRRIGQQMHQLVCEVDPVIGECMSYVDYQEYNLEREAAETRLSIKRAARAAKTNSSGMD
ncbi:MAG: FAD-dependent thymidylate synthase [bacterium]|nr:FAD-dependent thymidylate synthase [bacterium]